MTTPTEQREQALAAVEGSCPRCGAPRAAEQEYCVECGLRLPSTRGRLAALRRRWIRRVGWYPGDWAWISLLTLLVAVAGAVVAIVLTRDHRSANAATIVAPTVPAVSVHEPATSPPVDTSTLPTPPEQTTATRHSKPPKAAAGPIAWPSGESGWTIVLVSYPKATGQAAARSTAAEARHDGLSQVGILDSSAYPSLQPGYFVVFTGVYSTQDDAAAGVPTARQAGFSGAYVRQVAG